MPAVAAVVDVVVDVVTLVMVLYSLLAVAVVAVGGEGGALKPRVLLLCALFSGLRRVRIHSRSDPRSALLIASRRANPTPGTPTIPSTVYHTFRVECCMPGPTRTPRRIICILKRTSMTKPIMQPSALPTSGHCLLHRAIGSNGINLRRDVQNSIVAAAAADSLRDYRHPAAQQPRCHGSTSSTRERGARNACATEQESISHPATEPTRQQ